MEVHIIAGLKVFGRLVAKVRFNYNWDPMVYQKTVPTNLPCLNRDLEWQVCQTPESRKNIIEFVSFRLLEKELLTGAIR